MRSLFAKLTTFGAMIRPPWGSPANVAMARSISLLLCASRPTNLILNEDAAASADLRYPTLGGSGRIKSPMRSICGAISRSFSSHFPPIEGWKLAKPVTLPPGRARSLRNQSTGMEVFVLIRRNCRFLVCVPLPSFHQSSRNLAAGLDEKGAGTHRRVADLEV